MNMSISCADLTQKYVDTLSSRFTCEMVGDYLRVVTPYLYPNNDLIEVFIQELSSDAIKVTDLGETLRNLHTQGVDASTRFNRRDTVEIIASSTGVDVAFGQLTKTGAVSELGEILFDVIVAARGVSDLIYTSRAYGPATFTEEVVRFLTVNHLGYEPSAKLTGQTGHIYTVQFRIYNGPIYLQTLSPKQARGAKAQVDSVFRMWFDCNGDLGPERKISLLNDIDIRWRPDNVALLGKVSTVLHWSRREELIAMLGSSS